MLRYKMGYLEALPSVRKGSEKTHAGVGQEEG
jgi:hypothetical protein